tara:strand:+ start:90 stop:488 length:399 start_codon:yes stop_codon:yes gene_type:complete
MATITLRIESLDIEAEEISLMSWEAPEILEASGITPEDLHGEWTALDLYIRDDCVTDLNFERVVNWIVEGDVTDTELRDLSYRMVLELQARLESIRGSGDRLRETISQQAERIYELQRASEIDSSDKPAAIA